MVLLAEKKNWSAPGQLSRGLTLEMKPEGTSQPTGV